VPRVAWTCGVALAAVGCGPTFDSVDEACPDGGLAGASVPADLVAPLERIDCHRRYLGLPRLSMDAAAMDAATAHAQYLESHDPRGTQEAATLGAWRGQAEDTDAAFTGADVEERLQQAGVGFQGMRGWDAYLGGLDGDVWMRDPFARTLLLQPSLRGLGASIASMGDVEVVVLHGYASVPSNRAVERPVAWPANGSTGTPRNAAPPAWLTWPVSGAGQPVSLVFGGASVQPDDSLPSANPYRLRESGDQPLVLETAEGDVVDGDVWMPSGEELGLIDAVLVWPQEPLAPDTTYRLTGRVDASKGTFATVRVSFTTGSE